MCAYLVVMSKYGLLGNSPYAVDMFLLQIAIDKDNLDKSFIQLTIEFVAKQVKLSSLFSNLTCFF